MLLAAMKQREVDERITLTDGRHRGAGREGDRRSAGSHRQFSAGGRNDLVNKETAEIAVLTPLSAGTDERRRVDAVLAAAVAEVAATGVTGNAAMGDGHRQTQTRRLIT